MKITRQFAPADRYLYDFGPCSYANGFAQIDTAQDAAYFGTWANPITLVIFTYCEGDTTHQQCDSIEEFVAELRRIDPGLDPAMKDVFQQISLADLLH